MRWKVKHLDSIGGPASIIIPMETWLTSSNEYTTVLALFEMGIFSQKIVFDGDW